MPDEVYEVVSQAARYWFLFLMALIVWRSFRWLRRDRRQRKKRQRLLPDAGYVGELVVLRGSDELPEGLALPISGEGVLGCLRGDDVYVPVRGVAKRHLWYEYDEENGIRVQPYRHCGVEVDEKSLTGGRSHAYLTHGSRLSVGDAVLRLRMFAGFEQAGARYAPLVQEQEEEMPQGATRAAAVAPETPAAAPVTFTAEQVAALQRMQWEAWQAQQRTAASGNVLSTAAGDFAAPPKTANRGAILDEDEETELEDGYGDTPDLPPSPEQPPRASARLRRAPLPPLAAETPAGIRRADARGAEDAFTEDDIPADDGFYPPVEDDELLREPAEPDDAWPYAPFPQSDARFENGGYTYPEYVEPPDVGPDSGTDGDEPPRSLYLDPDEAAEAKRRLWDKYLKGGHR